MEKLLRELKKTKYCNNEHSVFCFDIITVTISLIMIIV